MAYPITLIPGDGIGPEVTEATRRALDAAGVAIDWDVQEAGTVAFEREGNPLPDRVVASVRERGVALKGPLSTPLGGGYRSPSVAMREALDLHSTIRPCRSLEGAPSAHPGTDIVVVKMNHEDLYAGIEYEAGTPDADRLRRLVEETAGAALADDAGISLKPISASGAERVIRQAFAYATEHGRRRVTAVHKASLMRSTDGLFLRVAQQVAEEFPDLTLDDALVDAVCEQLVGRPDTYDVLVLPRMYGDIVSGIAAAQIGGVGVSPGVNIGDRCAVFEAAHGSAPGHAGRNRANPMALMLSGAMLLRHLGEEDAAERLTEAVAVVVREGQTVTYDLKPGRALAQAAGTAEVADAVIAAMEGVQPQKP